MEVEQNIERISLTSLVKTAGMTSFLLRLVMHAWIDGLVDFVRKETEECGS